MSRLSTVRGREKEDYDEDEMGWEAGRRGGKLLAHSFPPSLTHSLTYSCTHARTHSLTHSFTHSLTHSFTHSLTHSLIHSLVTSPLPLITLPLYHS